MSDLVAKGKEGADDQERIVSGSEGALVTANWLC